MLELREEILEIFKEVFGADKAYKVLEFIESRVRTDVATQEDIYELRLEIEKTRADVSTRIEEVRAELSTRIEEVRAGLSSKIEKVRADLLKWTFAFWLTQMAFLAGILFKLLS
ncbi:DUF1640 domain-containing protein [candidate division KSB1 bacterium]|nr:DUF1640 domain-containing protein [candidate division KSB1 bacterium]NIR71556.1 DUF1640 domain-containing protein [candidate division KSB1 bacterium]NIS26352.1 DUF1640 domain-containing protein [candidate division KSB1 bacterium]NIT73119.1 DUF1640 domain-containing protein [candidate division KSB1 bacterium]NIU27035.1 DUF1640 domain-containing protein [candidate division KSB1 bacterium]